MDIMTCFFLTPIDRTVAYRRPRVVDAGPSTTVWPLRIGNLQRLQPFLPHKGGSSPGMEFI